MAALYFSPSRSAGGRCVPEQSDQSLERAGRPIRVLIVEDDALIAMDLATIVRSFGGAVVGVAKSASEAVSLVVENRPDVVVVDVYLSSGPDGLTLAKAIRELYRIGIVICTGHADPRTMTRIRQFGNAELVLKPAQRTELRDAILRAAAVP